MDSKVKGGIALSFIGGLASLGLTFIIPFLFYEYLEDPKMVMFVSLMSIILQVMCLIGGIITIIGALIAIFNLNAGKVIIIIGAIVSGINIITILGASMIKKGETQQFHSQQKIPVYEPNTPEYVLSQYMEQNSDMEDEFINKKKQERKKKELERAMSGNPLF